jgi:hypothetical protein
MATESILTVKTIENAPFKRGDRVIDKSGYRGNVADVTVWRGDRWYSVRFDGGLAVRFDSDLERLSR